MSDNKKAVKTEIEKTTPSEKPKVMTVEDWGRYYASEPKVTIRIPIDQRNPQDLAVPVSVNGYRYQINRGVSVEVPKTVAEVLEFSGYLG